MTQKIYGVDLNKKLTPLIVRDAIVECFRQAHCLDSGVGIEGADTNNLYCLEIVRKAFADAKTDFNKPDKQAILLVLENLKGFATKFRDQKIIQKHYGEIMKLVDKL